MVYLNKETSTLWFGTLLLDTRVLDVCSYSRPSCFLLVAFTHVLLGCVKGHCQGCVSATANRKTDAYKEPISKGLGLVSG